MISLISEAGLGNRLRAMDSAILLANATGHSLSVWWPANRYCSARFKDLFEPVLGVRADSFTARVIDRLAPLKFKGQIKQEVKEHLPEIRKARLVAIRSDSPFYYPESFKWLKPLPHIQQRIDAIEIGGTIGIHIRRGDHVGATKANPTNRFVSAMRERDNTFFLATDDHDLKLRLRQEFGARIITQDIDYSRDSLGGIESAVVDMFCLAKCSEIWGSKGSSFSEVAHHLRKPPLRFPASI
jgi:hypothetical protein